MSRRFAVRILAVAVAAVTLTACGASDAPDIERMKPMWQQEWNEWDDLERVRTCNAVLYDNSLSEALLADPATADIAGEYTGFLMTRCIGWGYDLW